MKKISEEVRVDQALAPKDIATADQTGAYFSLENYSKAMAVVTTASVPDTNTVTLQLMQAQDAAGTGAKVLGDPVAYTVANAAGEAVTIQGEVNASQLDEGFTHITAQVSCDAGAAVNGAALLIRGSGRYGTSMA